jgi:GNAT superfamily N-acetyltransferase
VHLWTATVDGTTAATGALVLCGDHGYLLGTQVLERFRGRGAYRALVAARLAFLRARGIDYAVTIASATTSGPILARLGFETLHEIAIFRIDPRGLPHTTAPAGQAPGSGLG